MELSELILHVKRRLGMVSTSSGKIISYLSNVFSNFGSNTATATLAAQ